ncbi:MAG: pyridoxamine kinase [Firmicutes bacterium]|nr:pyridoxamine kinase [Bacillota bacterium]
MSEALRAADTAAAGSAGAAPFRRVLTVQDISCVGQCSGSVALPVIAACGVEAVILPTAVLSTHTGGFKSPHFRDLSEDIPAISAHWKREGIYFDAVYTGYLGSIEQIASVRELMDRNGAPGCVRIVDPAMADNGKLYSGFDMDFAAAMRELVAAADIALPNITEAAMLTGREYRESYDEAYIKDLMEAVLDLGAKAVVLTGVSYDSASTGVAVMRAAGGSDSPAFSYYRHRKAGERGWYGTGDIFASAFTGAYMRGRSMEDSARIAAEFACRCIELSLGDQDHAYGTKFQLALPELIDLMREG